MDDMFNEERNEFIEICSKSGCTTNEIKSLLSDCNIILSTRQIQRILRGVKLKGSFEEDERNFQEIQEAIDRELNGPASLLGYRSIWMLLKKKHNLTVRRDTVMMMLANLDSEGTALRKAKKLKRRIYRSKGPNFAWHCDGYDKLKPFGITIHGCIDGYSRRILWLKVAESNNNPKYIATYFVECVKTLGGCPRILRSDKGTENATLAVIQPMMRHCHDDIYAEDGSYRYGRSVSNQKIEALWSQLRKQLSEWWITFFKDLEMNGHLCTRLDYHLDAVRFSFGSIIQHQLDAFTKQWNSHRIRYSSMTELPSGVPNVLFNFPQIKGVQDYLCHVDGGVLKYVEEEYCCNPNTVCKEFQDLAVSICCDYNLPLPTTFEQGLEIYFILINVIERYV